MAAELQLPNNTDSTILTLSSSTESVIELSGDGGASVKVTHVAEGTNISDGVTRSQVNNYVAGLLLKSPALVADNTTNRDLNDAADASNDEIDGITMVVGYRVLLNSQTDATENGIYEVASLSPIVLTRSSDMDDGGVCSGFTLFSQIGTYTNTLWNCSNDSGTDVIGTDNITFIIIQSERSVAPIPSSFTSTLLNISNGNATEVTIDPIPNALRVTKVPGNNSQFNVNANGIYLISAHLHDDDGLGLHHRGKFSLWIKTTTDVGVTSISTNVMFPFRRSGPVTATALMRGEVGDIFQVYTTSGSINVTPGFTALHYVTFLRLTDFH